MMCFVTMGEWSNKELAKNQGETGHCTGCAQQAACSVSAKQPGKFRNPSFLHCLSTHNLEMVITDRKTLCLWPAPFRRTLGAEDSARSPRCAAQSVTEPHEWCPRQPFVPTTTETTGSAAHGCCWLGCPARGQMSLRRDVQQALWPVGHTMATTSKGHM